MPDEPVSTESSPVADPAPDFASFHKTETSRALGKPESAPAPKESAPTEGAEPTAATKPEPQPGTAEGKSEAGDKAKTEKRFQELLKDRAELKAKLEAAEAKLKEPKEVAKPESTPAAKPDGKQAAPVKPVKPKQDAFATWDEFQAALDKHDEAKDKYFEDLADFKLKQAEEQRVSKDQQSVVERAWNERVTAVKAKHADFDEVAKNIPFNESAAGFLLDSEIGPEILYHLGSNLEEAERIKGLNPYQTARELTRIEDSLKKPVAAGPKKVPSAPAPPPEVGSRSTVAADEAEEALAAGDFAKFHRLENAKVLGKR